jgi:ATP-binding cassette, subfamily B, multidrug efflux pump
VVKLMKYLKPFTVLLITAVVLLFVQAMSDLALPDYMSNIVNIGIQQDGIESSVPEAVRKSKMDKLTVFMDEGDRENILENYELVDKSSKDYDEYLEKYPALENTSVYVLKDIDQDEIDSMNTPMGKAFLAVSSIEKMKLEIPNSQLPKISSEINKKFTSLGKDMVTQAAASSVKEEYEALGMDTVKIQRDYIIHTGIIMLLISLIGAAATISVGLLAARIAAGLSKNLRRDLFTHVENFSRNEFDKFSTASLITRTTNDITQIQLVVFLAIRMVIYAPILGIGGIIRAVNKSVSMSWIIVLAVVVLIGLIGGIFLVAFPKFKIIQKLVDKLNLITRENLSGMMVIRAFNTEKFEEKRFDRENKNLTKTNLFVNRVMSAMFPVMMLVMNGITILVVWVGAHQIAHFKYASWRYDGIYAICYADYICFSNDVLYVYYDTKSICFSK